MLVVVSPFFYGVIHDYYWLPRNMCRTMSNAKRTGKIENIIGSLGVILTLKNGEWIAINYQDSHAVGMGSYSLALDSKGRWFESRKHFCGKFRMYKFKRKSYGEFLEENPEVDSSFEDTVYKDSELYDIESAWDLKQAEKLLVKMGFDELK